VGRPNIFATIAGTSTGRSLLIEGHTDVVAIGDKTKWTVDPWGGSISDGKLFGRGACDMKAGLAAAAIAARAIAMSAVKLRGTLHLAAFVDEENMMAGVRHFVRNGGASNLSAAITVEPTFGLGIGTVFCCRSRADVTFVGQPGHTGLPPRCGVGVNAVHMAWRLIKALEERIPSHEPDSLYGPSHWQVVSIEGGDRNEATIPPTCTVRIDARTVPGHDPNSIWRYVDQLLLEFSTENPAIVARIDAVPDYGTASWSTPLSSEIVRCTGQSYRDVIGRDAPVNQVRRIPAGTGQTLKVSTDVHHIAALGIPCLCIGAGGGNAHMADEFVRVEEISLLAKTLAVIALRYLGYESD
jgi:succinyl-diaminopimelate desuccinylase